MQQEKVLKKFGSETLTLILERLGETWLKTCLGVETAPISNGMLLHKNQ